MDHGPSTEWKEDAKTSRLKSRIGIWMFAAYSIIYAAFIIINVIDPKLMGLDIGNLNLAIVYGFGLIVIALILALVYNAICNSIEKKASANENAEKKSRGGNQ
jgi:uncharacterized membrane protein (DUF485 family)